jgi:hypothetical protein
MREARTLNICHLNLLPMFLPNPFHVHPLLSLKKKLDDKRTRRQQIKNLVSMSLLMRGDSARKE